RRRARRPAGRPDVRRQGSLRRRRASDRRGQPRLGAPASGADAPRLGGAAPARRRRDADRQDRHRRGLARHPWREPLRRPAAQPEGPRPPALPATLVVAVDAFGFADAETAAALQPMVRRLSALVNETREDLLAPPGLSVWARAQRTLQPHEAWLTFKDWIDRANPRMAFSVARSLVVAGAIPESERQWAAMMRAEARARLAWLVPPGTILCMPTTPFPAPPKGLP